MVKVRDGMTRLVLTIGPAHTLREAARLMSARHVGAAVVTDDDHAAVHARHRPRVGRVLHRGGQRPSPCTSLNAHPMAITSYGPGP